MTERQAAIKTAIKALLDAHDESSPARFRESLVEARDQTQRVIDCIDKIGGGADDVEWPQEEV